MPTRAELSFADTTIEVVSGASIPARIYGKHEKRRAGAPATLVVHFHGGAFISGDLQSGERMARILVDAGAVVVSVGYPLAPDHRFPDAVESGYAALEWAYKLRAKLAGKDALVYVAGDEAGGNLAAAIALMARDRAHPPLAGQILIAPMLDPCVGTASLRESQQCASGCKWADGWQQYLRGPMDAEHPYAVPGRATRLKDLAPALVLTGGDDPMRDEAMGYAQRLRDAGVAVTSEVLGVPTDWPESLAEPQTEECPCTPAVREHLLAFFAPATPPPS